jgi:hypothetical protein
MFGGEFFEFGDGDAGLPDVVGHGLSKIPSFERRTWPWRTSAGPCACPPDNNQPGNTYTAFQGRSIGFRRAARELLAAADGLSGEAAKMRSQITAFLGSM